MQITKDTPWRHMGRVPYAVWKKRITDAGGLTEAAQQDVWEACGDDSALMLEFLHAESSYASDFAAIPAAKRNPWNLQIAGVGLTFPTIREAALAWRNRLYDPLYKQGIYTRTNTIADLIGTYAPASDGNDTEGYIRKVVAGINANGFDPPVTTPATPEVPVEQETPTVADYNYNNGIMPPFKDYEVRDAAKFAGYIAPADHIIRAFVIHSAYGSLKGSTQWFQGGNALTDYMVGNSYDGPELDGELRRFNNPNGGRYAWASGPVNNPIEDAAKFLEIYGPNKEVVNMFTTALERSCAANVATNPVTEKEHKTRVWLIAYYANEYGKYLFKKTGKHLFTCDTFPIIPSENNRSFLMYHGEINAGKRDTCPDPLVRQTLDRIIADVRAMLANWQKASGTTAPEPTPTPTYAQPKPIDGLQAYKDKDATPALVTVDGKTYIFVSDRVRAVMETPRRQTAELDAEPIGPAIAKGTEFAVNWLFYNDDDQPWYITPYWTRVPVAATQRIKDEAA